MDPQPAADTVFFAFDAATWALIQQLVLRVMLLSAAVGGFIHTLKQVYPPPYGEAEPRRARYRLLLRLLAVAAALGLGAVLALDGFWLATPRSIQIICSLLAAFTSAGTYDAVQALITRRVAQIGRRTTPPADPPRGAPTNPDDSGTPLLPPSGP